MTRTATDDIHMDHVAIEDSPAGNGHAPPQRHQWAHREAENPTPILFTLAPFTSSLPLAAITRSVAVKRRRRKAAALEGVSEDPQQGNSFEIYISGGVTRIEQSCVARERHSSTSFRVNTPALDIQWVFIDRNGRSGYG
jgi:hypothetical protein